MLKKKLKKNKDFFLKIPRFLVEHAFLTFLTLIFFAFIFGGLVFYSYGALVESKEFKITEETFLFDEKVFQDIIEIREQKEKKFEEADFKEYSDLFYHIPLEEVIENEEVLEEVTEELTD